MIKEATPYVLCPAEWCKMFWDLTGRMTTQLLSSQFNLRFLFWKKIETRKKTPNQTVTHQILFLCMISQKYSCNGISFLLAGVWGWLVVSLLQTTQQLWLLAERTQENVAISWRSVLVTLYRRAQVAPLSCAKERKLQSSETVSCRGETQACDAKKSQVRIYITSTRVRLTINTLVYAQNSLRKSRLQYLCSGFLSKG